MAENSIAARIRALGPERLATMTRKEIAAMMGCSHVHVRFVLLTAGLPCKKDKKGPKDTGRLDQVRPYVGSGMAWNEVAAELGVTPAVVRCAVYRLRREGRPHG